MKMKTNRRRVEIVVALWIDEYADVHDVLQEMTYSFDHPSIDDTEIVDIRNEEN